MGLEKKTTSMDSSINFSKFPLVFDFVLVFGEEGRGSDRGLEDGGGILFPKDFISRLLKEGRSLGGSLFLRLRDTPCS